VIHPRPRSDVRCESRFRTRAPSVLVAALSALAVMIAADMRASAQSGDLKALIDDLVAANRILYRQGVVDGFGHVSARHPGRPDRFLMAAAKAPGRVTTDDIMEFDLDAKPIDRRDRPIYSERFIHSEVYKARADVAAVIHSHSPAVIPFSVTQVQLRPVHNTASFLAVGVPVFEMRNVAGMSNNLVSDSTRGRALAETLGNRPVALLRGHGNVVVGPDVRRAVARAIYTEVNARMLLQAVMLGGPITFIDPEENKAIESDRRTQIPGHSVDRVWQMWLEEALPGANLPAERQILSAPGRND
jgi:ribulose-5-phosphate 4-epimerase/fuculose-1-phosphate aldolase